MERVVPRKAPSAGASRVPFGLDEHPEIADLIRRAAARPDCRFFDPGRINLRNAGDPPPMRELADAVAVNTRLRLQRGDLASAWDDIVVLFRMARHLDRGRGDDLSLHSLAIEKQALDLAMEWAGASGQTPDRLRAAIVADLALPRMTPAEEVVRGEGAPRRADDPAARRRSQGYGSWKGAAGTRRNIPSRSGPCSGST